MSQYIDTNSKECLQQLLNKCGSVLQIEKYTGVADSTLNYRIKKFGIKKQKISAPEEVFDIPNYEGLYAITKDGRVWSYYTNKFMSPCRVGVDRQYKRVILHKNREEFIESIHRLVAETFISNPNNLPEVNHKDGNKENNYYKNLEWVNSSENAYHAYQNGLNSQKHRRKLSDHEAYNVKDLFFNHNYTQDKLAKMYKVTRATIQLLLKGITYKDIILNVGDSR